jgi:hypothetical protein
LKDLGFLTADGTPTQRYHDYRDKSRSRVVLGQAIREAYEEVFHIKENPTKSDRAAIEGRFKSTHNASDRVATLQAATFLALLDLADLTAKVPPRKKKEEDGEKPDRESAGGSAEKPGVPTADLPFTGLRYNIEVHLPATKDVEVYNAIFKYSESIFLKIDRSNLREWLFRGLMFEAEAEQFRSAGIRVGADAAVAERALLEETLDPFSIDSRNEALQMARTTRSSTASRTPCVG